VVQATNPCISAGVDSKTKTDKKDGSHTRIRGSEKVYRSGKRNSISPQLKDSLPPPPETSRAEVTRTCSRRGRELGLAARPRLVKLAAYLKRLFEAKN